MLQGVGMRQKTLESRFLHTIATVVGRDINYRFSQCYRPLHQINTRVQRAIADFKGAWKKKMVKFLCHPCLDWKQTSIEELKEFTLQR